LRKWLLGGSRGGTACEKCTTWIFGGKNFENSFVGLKVSGFAIKTKNRARVSCIIKKECRKKIGELESIKREKIENY
jgi:hypothetical protein